jgi:hypothetical protein
MIGNRQTMSHDFGPSFGIKLDGGTVTEPNEMPAPARPSLLANVLV